MPFPSLENFKIRKKIANRLCYSLYDAIDKRDDKAVFLKILDREHSDNQAVVANFTNNARILRVLSHPTIAKIYDSGEDKGYYFISSEPIEFEPLKSLILETFSLSFIDLTTIFTKLTKFLTYAHLHGIVHGFLNPNCVYINSSSDIKIDDLGFNWFIPNIFTSETKESAYLAQYIAPEYYRSVEQADGRGDIYSLGVVLFEFLTGKTPFDKKELAGIQAQHLSGEIPPVDYKKLQLPVEFKGIINKSINRSIDKRFQNSNEFAKSLEFLKEKYLEVPAPLEISEQQVTKPEAKVKENKGQSPPPIPEFSIEEPSISYELSWLKSVPKKFLNAGMIVLALIAIVILGQTFFFDNNGSDDVLNGFAQTSPKVTDLPVTNIPDENLNSATSTLSASDSPSSLLLADQTNASEIEDFPKSNGQDSEKLTPIKEPKRIPEVDASTTKNITPPSRKKQVADITPKVNRTGTIVINAVPGADSVFVNDVLMTRKTPHEMKLQKGEYRVRLVNSDLNKSWDQTVNLQVGQIVNVKRDFTAIEYGKVAISLKNAYEFGFGYVYVDGKIWHEKHNTTPLEVNLEVGSHKIEVRREGFVNIPADTSIVVGKNTKQFISFRLAKK